MNIFRVIFDIVLFLSLFIVPWYVVFLMIVFGVVFFQNYYEAIFMGLLIDTIYSISSPNFLRGRFGAWTTSFLIIFLIKEKLKEIIFVR